LNHRPLKVMIADDEAAARRFLARQVERCSLALELVGEAAAGPELVTRLKSLRPDILLLDIMMPGFSGLDALRALHEEHRELKTVVVSAYDRFDFAQDALKLGVVDYLLKPVRPDDLLASIAKCGEEIVAEWRQAEAYESLRMKAQLGSERVQQSLVRCLVERTPERPARELENDLASFGLDRPRGVIVAEYPSDGYDAVSELLPDWAREQRSMWCFGQPGRLVVLPYGEREGKHSALRIMAEELRRALAEQLDESKVRVAFAGPASDTTELARLYDAASVSLNLACLTGKQLTGAPLMESSEGFDPAAVLRLESELVDELRSGSPQEAQTLLTSLVEQAAILPNGDHGALATELVAVVTVACRVLLQQMENPNEILKLRNSAVDRLLSLGSVCEQVAVAQEFVREVFNRIQVEEDSSHRIVSTARQVLEERVGDNITLSDVASEVHVSPYYLSRLFKEVCGVNFQDYLTDLRISRAKQLLRNSDLACLAVGARVGYSSPSYFSQIFKRSTGKSPGEYREAVRKAMEESADTA